MARADAPGARRGSDARSDRAKHVAGTADGAASLASVLPRSALFISRPPARQPAGALNGIQLASFGAFDSRFLLLELGSTYRGFSGVHSRRNNSLFMAHKTYGAQQDS